MFVAGSATEQISRHLQYASQPPFAVLIQIPKNIKMTDKFRGRKLFVTNCATEHSHYLILTTVTSISNYRSPFKEREVDGRQILWQKIFCQQLCHEAIKTSIYPSLSI